VRDRAAPGRVLPVQVKFPKLNNNVSFPSSGTRVLLHDIFGVSLSPKSAVDLEKRPVST